MRPLTPHHSPHPKRDLSSPITQNHLAGSKKLYNFFDSVFAIGMSAKDNRLRYIKQVKVRAGAFKYDASNVLVYDRQRTRIPQIQLSRIRNGRRTPSPPRGPANQRNRNTSPRTQQTRPKLPQNSRRNRPEQIHRRQHHKTQQRTSVHRPANPYTRWTNGQWTNPTRK